jgi:hypothetical protein
MYIYIYGLGADGCIVRILETHDVYFFACSLQVLEDPNSSRVCQQCLVGWTLPVLRQQTLKNKWEFGTVEAYNDQIGRHSLRFMDDKSEWITVESTAFAQYIDHCKLVFLESHKQTTTITIRLEEETKERSKSDKENAPFELGNENDKVRTKPFFVVWCAYIGGCLFCFSHSMRELSFTVASCCQPAGCLGCTSFGSRAVHSGELAAAKGIGEYSSIR